ncbi:hypothetical protein OH809_15335 [Streptomyces sp. NBC_00873]|uniref:hypothetical protein n=1 Tax=Streptomyces sp. NBC_00873 TaxID=2975852 RepID=UPI0038695622|nr:hypothetical protein OH809_15335 [Streptomyces sp. NBC_00873]
MLRETGGTRQGRLESGMPLPPATPGRSRGDAAENGLCFGRLDLRDGDQHSIGRVGLPAESAADDLLPDWRAENAAAALDDGRPAVIAPDARRDELGAAVARRPRERCTGTNPTWRTGWWRWASGS